MGRGGVGECTVGVLSEVLSPLATSEQQSRKGQISRREFTDREDERDSKSSPASRMPRAALARDAKKLERKAGLLHLVLHSKGVILLVVAVDLGEGDAWEQHKEAHFDVHKQGQADKNSKNF